MLNFDVTKIYTQRRLPYVSKPESSFLSQLCNCNLSLANVSFPTNRTSPFEWNSLFVCNPRPNPLSFNAIIIFPRNYFVTYAFRQYIIQYQFTTIKESQKGYKGFLWLTCFYQKNKFPTFDYYFLFVRLFCTLYTFRYSSAMYLSNIGNVIISFLILI